METILLDKYFPTFSKILPKFPKKSLPALADDASFFRTSRMLNLEAGADLAHPYLSSTSVYAAAHKISQNISQVPLKIYTQQSKDKTIEITDGAIFDLLQSPNIYMSREQLIESTILYLLLNGEAFWILDGRDNVTKLPQEIWCLDPARFNPIQNNQGILTGWAYRNANKTIQLNTWEVIQFKFLNPYSELRGLSPLTSAGYFIQLEVFASQFNASFFKNGANFGGSLQTDKRLTDDQFKRLIAQFENRHSGVSRAHKIAILEDGIKFIENRLSQKDMDFNNLYKIARQNIFAALNVNSVVLGMYEDVKSYEGIKTAHKTYWQECLIPKMNMITNKLDHGLFKDIEGGKFWLSFDLSQVSALHEDFDEKVAQAKTLVEAGFDGNQINELLGLGFGEGAWSPKFPKIQELQSADMSKTIEPEFIKNKIPRQAEPATPFKKGELEAKAANVDDKKHILDAYLERMRSEFNSDWLFNPVLELLNKCTDLKEFGDKVIDCFGYFDNKLSDLLSLANAASFMAGRYQVHLHNQQQLNQTKMITKGAEVNYFDLPFEEAIKFFQDKIEMTSSDYHSMMAEEHLKGFTIAGMMNSDMLADTKKAVEKGLVDGTTLHEFRKDFSNIIDKYGWEYKGNSIWRADTIFRTNMNTSFAVGRYKQQKEVSYILNIKKYITAGDDRVRDEHARWDGVTLPFDDPWWDNHEPPVDPPYNCRCSTLTYMEGTVPIKEAPEDDIPQTSHIKDAWWEQPSEQAMADWEKQGTGAWEYLTPTDTVDKDINLNANDLNTIDKIDDRDDLRDYIAAQIGGDKKIYSFIKDEFKSSLLVNAKVLSEHLDLDRTPYLPYFFDSVNDPDEIWSSVERNKLSGAIELRQRTIKGYEIGDEKDKYLISVFQSRDGKLESWTMIPTSNKKYMQKQRIGRLIWSKED
jgi:HK97 family phage portal protein